MKTLTERQIKNRIKKEEAALQALRDQKPAKEVTISIEWLKSRMYGRNPRATAIARHHDGSITRLGPYRASGCGYDKASTLVADAFNDCLAYKLFNREETPPYGIRIPNDYEPSENGWIQKPYFEGGVGMSCYPDICLFIGGMFETITSTPTVDVYRWTDSVTA